MKDSSYYGIIQPLTNDLKLIFNNIISICNCSCLAPYWKGDNRCTLRFIVDVSSINNIIEICECIHNMYDILPLIIRVNGNDYLNIDNVFESVDYVKNKIAKLKG